MRYAVSMEDSQAKRGGRPAGKAYPHVRSMRFSDRDVERLDKLAEKLEMPDVMVVRQALREMAISRGVEPDGDGAE